MIYFWKVLQVRAAAPSNTKIQRAAGRYAALPKGEYAMKGHAVKGQPFKISINRLWVISNCLIMAAFFSLNSFFSQSSYKKVLEQQFEVKQYQMLVYISDTLEQSMQSIELLSRSTVNNYSIINNILNY